MLVGGILLLVAVSAVIALSGLGDESSADGDRCERVMASKLNDIEAGLEAGLSLRIGQAVRSGDYENVWMVAADIQGPGMEGRDEVGVWEVNSLRSGNGLIFAVDSTAREFTDWGEFGRSTGFGSAAQLAFWVIVNWQSMKALLSAM